MTFEEMIAQVVRNTIQAELGGTPLAAPTPQGIALEKKLDPHAGQGELLAAELRGDILTMKVKIAPRSKPSSKGKMNMWATSGGWVLIPGTDLKISYNIGSKT